LKGAEICMHASFGPVRISQTTGSMISHLTHDQNTHWLTGTAAPCTSIFKPVWFDSGLPELGPSPNGTYNDAVLWWRHENLHREILRDYATRIKVVEVGRSPLESDFLDGSVLLTQESRNKKMEFSESCFSKASRVEEIWLDEIKELPINNNRPLLDKITWRKLDQQAGRKF